MDWWQYQVTQGFGPTNEPLDSGYGGYAHFNKGIDYGVPAGTPVRSVVSGTVISAGDVGDGWGTRVWIRDADGNTHNLGHLGSANVSVGQTVLAGQTVGVSGNTGASTGPHVSYDVWDPKGNYFDPSAFIQQAPGAAPSGASPPMTMDPIDAAIAQALGGSGQSARQVGYSADELMGAGGINQALGQIVAQGTLYQLRDDGKYYSVYTQMNPPNTSDDYKVYSPQEIASLPGYRTHSQVGPNLLVQYTDGSSQVFAQRQGGWAPQGIQQPKAAGTGYYSIPQNASARPAGTSTLAPDRAPQQIPGAPPGMMAIQSDNPTQWDALSIANYITGGLGGQQFNQYEGGGQITQPQFDLAGDIAANQLSNSQQILRAYGVDPYHSSLQDPIKAAAAAASLRTRQQSLFDQGFDPIQAQQIIMMENQGGGMASYEPPTSQVYTPGQGITVGSSGATYSDAFAQNYPQLVI